MMAGSLKGKLDSMPIGHKDIYNAASIRTTARRLLESNLQAEKIRCRWEEMGRRRHP